MNRTFKKVASIVLALVMVFSLIACTGGSTNDSGGGSTGGGGSAGGGGGGTGGGGTDTQPAFEDGPLVPFPETVTITYIASTDPNRFFHEGDTYEDNVWTRRYLRDLNIDRVLEFSVDGDSYDERLRTLLVAGDLPDIFFTYDQVFFREAHNAGYLTDLSPYFEEFATDGVREYRERFPDGFVGATIDGGLFAFPEGNDNFHTANYMWLRDDWLENTGMSAPVTVDDFIEVARAFTNDDPNGDGRKTYGFAMTSTVINNMASLLAAHGVPSTDWGMYYRRNGEITFSLIQPEVKDVLGILRDMYSEGLIDPEFIVKDMGVVTADILNGVVGMFDYRNWGNWWPFADIFEEQGVIYRPYPMLTKPGVERQVGAANNFGGGLTMLNSKHDTPSAFIKMINLFNQVAYESTDPDDFETYFTNSIHNLASPKTWLPTELYAPYLFEAFRIGSPENLPGAMVPYYWFIVNFENGTDTSRPAFGSWGQHHSRGTMIIALDDYRGAGQMVYNLDGWGGFRAPALLDNSEILGTMINTAFTDIIVGNRPLDAFDDFVQDWYANGGRQILEEMTAELG